MSRSQFLPDRYDYGFQQLKLTDTHLRLLEECAGVTLPKGVCVKKILCTPNLEKARFTKWINELEEKQAEAVNVY